MSSKIVSSYNVNGIRAAARKGLSEWIETTGPDFICFQEMRANDEDISAALPPMGYHAYHEIAEKKGYSGVSIFSKEPALNVQRGLGVDWIDAEGRVILAEYEHFNLVSAYFPSGTTGDIRQDMKMEFLEHFMGYAKKLLGQVKPLIICGDFNICHKEIDIHNPSKQHKTSGFLPEERAWVDSFIATGLNDAYRVLYPDIGDQYSWWSYRAGSKARNKGWRIDYHMISADLVSTVEGAKMEKQWDMSDHVPVTVTYSI
ncbi:MAG: exodeoxyribonuclease III [Bacteroidetes bacterium]|nr:exodeoxyribonuclease III [Bacteroidota bacterium]